MDLFSRYQNEFLELTESVTDRIDKITGLLGDNKRKEVEEAESELADAESTLQSMGMHARSLPTADKERCLAILRQHQQEVQDLKKKLLQAEITFTSTTRGNRDSLLNGATELQVTSTDHRERLVQVVDRNEENRNRLIASRQTLEQTIDLADDVLGELSEQRSRIEIMRDKLRDLNGKLDEAGRIITRMSRRLITHKLTLILIVLALLAIAAAILYLKFF
jgi:chromosome segregation ATPase